MLAVLVKEACDLSSQVGAIFQYIPRSFKNEMYTKWLKLWNVVWVTHFVLDLRDCFYFCQFGFTLILDLKSEFAHKNLVNLVLFS